MVYRFDSSLFVASAEVFRKEMHGLTRQAADRVRQLVVSAEGMNDTDITGGEALQRDLDDLEERIGGENFYLRVTGAVAGYRTRDGAPVKDAVDA